MVLSFARRERFVRYDELDLFGKSVQQALAELLGTQKNLDIQKNLFRTVRFRPEGFALFKKYAETGIELLSNVEDELFDKILDGNGISEEQRNAFSLARFESIGSDYQLAFTANEKIHKFLTEKGILTTFVDSRPLDFEYSFDNVPWDGTFKLSQLCLIEGNVSTGFGRGSREIGFPTANVACSEVLDLVPGVYAAVVEFNGIQFKGAVNIGWCPYYENKDLSYEVYILHEFSDSLVGQHLKVELVYYLRSEATFRSLEDLIQAIRLDVVLCDKLIQLD